MKYLKIQHSYLLILKMKAEEKKDYLKELDTLVKRQ